MHVSAACSFLCIQVFLRPNMCLPGLLKVYEGERELIPTARSASTGVHCHQDWALCLFLRNWLWKVISHQGTNRSDQYSLPVPKQEEDSLCSLLFGNYQPTIVWRRLDCFMICWKKLKLKSVYMMGIFGFISPNFPKLQNFCCYWKKHLLIY